MKLSTDHSFHIGEQHLRTGKPCQDYALSGLLNEELAYAIVSDGCSSGGMTDIGARLLALATERAIRENATDDATLTNVNRVRDAYTESFRTTLGLGHRDMLATNLFAVTRPNHAFINLTGDGVIAIRFGEELDIIRYDWEQNTPYYPAYRLAGQDQSYRQLQAEFERPLRCERLTTGATPCGYTIGQGMTGITITLTGNPENDRPLLSIGLFSDGVEQVDGMDTETVVRELMAFKSTKGEFATRRMNRFLTEARTVGKGPLDDIAMAVIHLSPGKPTET